MIVFHRCMCADAFSGKDVCDGSISIEKLREWIKASRKYSTDHHVFQGLTKMRLKNSYAIVCVGHDTKFKPLVVRKTKDAKLIRRMSDIVFDCITFGEPLGLRVREKCGIVPHKVILEKQLVLPSNSY